MSFKPSLLLILFIPLCALADGIAIDKVYQPYVNPLEREIEWRSIKFDGGEETHRLGLGRSINDDVFVEAYLIASGEDSFSLEAYELEALWQLTEQGEYNNDWGLLFELEREFDEQVWEAASALLMERQIKRWSVTANLGLKYEWGDEVESELESFFALQARYRYRHYLEPGISFYSAQDTLAIGPVLMGDVRFDAGKKLHWETGWVLGLKQQTPDHTFRFALEYEY